MDNILLIGNGFDIGHGYPTSYKEYDDMAQSFESIYNSTWWRSVGGFADIEKTKHYYLDIFMYVEEKLCEEFHSLITDNVWQEIFDEKFNKLNCRDNWYDFENYIKEDLNDPNGVAIKNIPKAIDDLKRFRRAFEIIVYLFPNYARNRQREKGIKYKRVSEIITNINPKYVINYNYTDTYSRLYNKEIQIDYVHGKANLNGNIDTCNIVFGTSDFEDDEKNKMFHEFTKCYQVKKFGIEFKFIEWLRDGNYTLHVYGHSLDVTDIDTLKIIFESKSIKKIVIWHMEKEKKLEKLKVTLGNNLYDAIKPK